MDHCEALEGWPRRYRGIHRCGSRHIQRLLHIMASRRLHGPQLHLPELVYAHRLDCFPLLCARLGRRGFAV